MATFVSVSKTKLPHLLDPRRCRSGKGTDGPWHNESHGLMIAFLGLITLGPRSRLGGEVDDAGEGWLVLTMLKELKLFHQSKKKGRIGPRLVGWDLVSQKVYHKWQLRMRLTRWGHIEASLCHGSGRSVRPCSQSSGKLFHGSGSPAIQGLKLMQSFVISCLLWAINLLDRLLQILPEFQIESTHGEPMC